MAKITKLELDANLKEWIKEAKAVNTFKRA